mgnify:CR=1 FL=1
MLEVIMNKHLKVSLTLTALSLTTIGLLTSCSASSDLDGLIEQNRVQLQGELRDAIKKAEQELNAAKTEIKALIDSGDKTNADELAKKIAELQESIELAKKTAASGDTAATAALEQKIEEAKNFVSEACAEGFLTVYVENIFILVPHHTVGVIFFVDIIAVEFSEIC